MNTILLITLIFTSIHVQNFFVVELFRQKFVKLVQAVMKNGSRCVVEFVHLIGHGLNNFRMAVPLVEGGKPSKKIVVLLPFDIPHENTYNIDLYG